jgi:hypothetical protein
MPREVKREERGARDDGTRKRAPLPRQREKGDENGYRGQHDRVRYPPVLDVDHRQDERDEREREEGGQVALEAAPPCGQGEEHGHRELDRRIPPRDRRAARCAPPAQREKRNDRHVLPPPDPRPALRAGARRRYDRFPARHAPDDDVREGSEEETRKRRESDDHSVRPQVVVA